MATIEKNDAMVITYWGVRGSIPSPLTSRDILTKQIALLERVKKDGGINSLFGDERTAERIDAYLRTLPLSISGTYGGDTTCLEIQVKDSPLIIIDAGSGMRDLGHAMMQRMDRGQNLNPLDEDPERKKEMHLLFTHYHWDHIQGFPFFVPGFIPGKNAIDIHCYGSPKADTKVSDILERQQSCQNFPVGFRAMPFGRKFTDLREASEEGIPIGEALIRYREVDHPGRSVMYSIEAYGKKFVCATDIEPNDDEIPSIVGLARNADLLYIDAQYTPEEYAGVNGLYPKKGWGHSTYEQNIRLALAADVKTVVLGHHEPSRDDFGLEKILVDACRFRDMSLAVPENSGKQLEVIMAYQGLIQRL